MPRKTRQQGTEEAAAPSPAGPTTASDAIELPRSILVRVLAGLGLKFRLSTCSLVSSAWAAAAAEATTAITVATTAITVAEHKWRWKPEHLEALAAWLRRHASAVPLHTLAVNRESGTYYCDYRREAPPSFALPLQQLQGLRVLILMPCVLPPDSFREVSSLTALTKLEMHDVRAPAAVAAAADDAANLAAAADLAHALQHLPALVSLKLGGASALALLPALTGGVSSNLAALEVAHASCITPELIAALPPGLTRLVLAAAGPGLRQYWGGVSCCNSVQISKQTTPRLGQLLQLQHLHLHGIRVACSQDGGLAALLEGLTRLTSFSMNGSTAVLDLNTDATHSDELADFLAAIGHLSALRSLNITGGFRCRFWGSDFEDEWDEGEEPDDLAPACAGLLASTSLTCLYLDNVTLPQGCGPHMFGRAGLRLPHLAVLHLEGVEDPECDSYPDAFLLPEDVASIVACCEGGRLRQLTLLGVVKPDADYSSLSALTTLTSLSLGGSTSQGVNEVVSLRNLDLKRCSLQDDTLAGIALQLTRLTSLSVWNLWLSERVERSDLLTGCCDKTGCGEVFVQDKEEDPPVSQQLTDGLVQHGILVKVPATTG